MSEPEEGTVENDPPPETPDIDVPVEPPCAIGEADHVWVPRGPGTAVCAECGAKSWELDAE